jgi:hypothetical protein
MGVTDGVGAAPATPTSNSVSIKAANIRFIPSSYMQRYVIGVAAEIDVKLTTQVEVVQAPGVRPGVPMNTQNGA